MSDIDIRIPTSRPLDQIKAAIEREINTRLPGNKIKRFWEGDVYRLVGMGADARISVTDGELRAFGTLKPPISLMKGRVEDGLRETMRLAAGEGGSSTADAGAAAAAPAAGNGASRPVPNPLRPPEALGPAPVEQIAALRKEIQGIVLDGASAPTEYTSNFGHIHRWTPRYVVKPASSQDVLAVITFAKKHDLTVSTRGSAHSQSELGISRGGILLDMKSMSRISDIDGEALTVTAESGTVWRNLVAATYNRGLVPPVLTNNLEVTLGGTLSIAGVGVASYKYGCQGDNVEALEVATMDGRLRVCTRTENSELFWGVLSGLGQFGIVTQVTLRLRRPKLMTRTYYLLYDDIRRFMEDAVVAMDSPHFDHVESWASSCTQGLKWVGGRRQPFAKWFFPFHLTVEHDPGHPPDDDAMLKGLRPYDNVHVDDLSTADFLNRLMPVFEVWKLLGTWDHPHPWMEVVLPWDTAAEFMDMLLPDLSPGVNVGGHVLMWPARRSVSEVPLFMTPDTDNLIGFGILPAVPTMLWEQVRERLDAASELAIAMGGKRYLSGYINFTREGWRTHFGDKWAHVCELKRTYDPEHRLNPGFVPFE